MSNNYQKNIRPFTSIVNTEFGRRVHYTRRSVINEYNILDDLQEQMTDYNFNKQAILYLDRYYRGDQPILYRKKEVRSDINNKVVENHAFELVESKVADLCGEPVQYALMGNEDEKLSKEIKVLNAYMQTENKASIDIERERWAQICGTSYIFVGNEKRLRLFDEAPFYLNVCNPAYTFVVYFSDDKTPAYSVQVLYDEDDVEFYLIYTTTQSFTIKNGEIINIGVNGNDMVPVVEYPNNERRLSAIELTIGLTDELNKMQSDRMNGIEQFVQALMMFKNCEISEDEFLKMLRLGAISVKTTTQGYDADVKRLSDQLDQQQSQVAKDDIYQNLLIVQGKPGRSESSSGDTGQAVVLRNGYYDEYKRAELRITSFLASEYLMLRLVLRKIRIASGGKFDLKLSDIDVKPDRSKLENLMVKAEVMQILHKMGVDNAEILKAIPMFSDVQHVIATSKDNMELQFKAENGLLENNEDLQ